jgi:hypothetical protein
MESSDNIVPGTTPTPTEDRLYMYGSLIVQALMSISIIVIAVIRFIQNKQNTRLNTIKNIYYTNKNKAFSTSDEAISINTSDQKG